MNEPCDICLENEAMRPLIDVSLSGVLDATIAECSRCGFRQVRPRLRRFELSLLYPDEYFDSGSTLGFSDYARQQQRAEREAYFLAKRLRRIAPTRRLLEVGSALGFLLDGIRRCSNWEVTGVDVSEFGVYFARRRYELDARCGTLEEIGFGDAEFDFIVQKDLLEHVPEPRAHLEETARVLKPGGYLWIITPNGDCNIRPLQRIREKIRDAREDRLPRIDQGHLSFFRLGHLLELFSQCGLEVVRARSIAVRRGMRSLGMLPMKKKSFITGPRGNVRVSREVSSPADGAPPNRASAMKAVYERVCRDLERSTRPMRSKPAYFRFRKLRTAMDTLPAVIPWGNDFDFLLRRR
jgi:SAM-dependent methyltransferase